jgi:hypothetical protein
MIKMIGRFFQRRREERIRALHHWDQKQQWLRYLRRRGIIMPLPRPDERNSQLLDRRILGDMPSILKRQAW